MTSSTERPPDVQAVRRAALPDGYADAGEATGWPDAGASSTRPIIRA